jgi:carboxypeptidase Taq
MVKTDNKTFDKLFHLSKRANQLCGISNLLAWDQEIYMPEKAAPIRAEQLELLAELSHDIKTGKEFEETLQNLIDIKTGSFKSNDLNDAEKAIVRLLRRDFLRDKKLPTSFVQEFTKVTSEAIFLWQKAKSKNDFQAFAPTLTHIVELVRKKAQFIGFDDHPYDALLDEYEPGATTKEITQLFDEIRKTSKEIIKKKASQTECLQIPATEEEQITLCRDVLQLVGFDFTRGRFDLSAHPFSTSYHPFDSRLTTRAESHGIITQILTALHEVGHSMYDMGLPAEYYGTPLCQPVSLGIHESQSRFWETRIGRSLPFWKMMFPRLQKYLSGMSLEQFYKELNKVTPSLIRTDADEVTYPLHVILRFEIEKELVQGSLSVKDLPERWNAGMKDLLGITPKTDAEGCLQDIHWSMGAFGYFPTYSLGNVYAANMFEAFSKAHPQWESKVEKGDFSFIRQWLSENVWQHGRCYDGKELIQKITQKPLRSAPFIHYLTEKYAMDS